MFPQVEKESSFFFYLFDFFLNVPVLDLHKYGFGPVKEEKKKKKKRKKLIFCCSERNLCSFVFNCRVETALLLLIH